MEPLRKRHVLSFRQSLLPRIFLTSSRAVATTVAAVAILLTIAVGTASAQPEATKNRPRIDQTPAPPVRKVSPEMLRKLHPLSKAKPDTASPDPRPAEAGPQPEPPVGPVARFLTVLLQNAHHPDVTVYAVTYETNGPTRHFAVDATPARSVPDEFTLEAKIPLPASGRAEVYVPPKPEGRWGPKQDVSFTASTRTSPAMVFRFQRHADDPKHLIKVLQYNAQFYPGGLDTAGKLRLTSHRDRGQDSYRAREIARRINAEGYDIIVLNEMFDNEDRELLINALRRQWATAGKQLYSYGPPDENHSLLGINLGKDLDEDGGVVIVSHFPIEPRQAHMLVFKDSTGEDSLANKGVLHVRLRRGNECIDVFATHLQAGKGDADAVRLKQLAQIRDFVRTHSDPRIPVLLLGDMNIRSSAPDYRKMCDILNEARRFRDVWPMLRRDLGATNDPLNPSSGEAGRIDYILYAGGSDSRYATLSPRSIELNHFLDARVRSLSDHSGVVATFFWSPSTLPYPKTTSLKAFNVQEGEGVRDLRPQRDPQ
jgi:endonuclease/exonuclease/phosphatase family metal-dependent hydrolase